ncbi:MAG: tetratricopeptide repeat protein [Bacteroidales bacterium]|nr:tetratricopeptide repeat protein [Bacteroidales bacterium]
MTRYILTIMLMLYALTLHAQTQAQVKALYDEGKYEEAKPGLEKLLKQAPANGNYNLWYGVSCLHTGDIQNAVKYLEQAVKRRVPSGQLYLGQAYNEAFRFEEAISTLEAYRNDLVKRKRDTEEADRLLEKSHNGLRQLRGVERVMVIDSMVVDKPAFLHYYKLSPESGTLSTDNPFSPKASLEGGTVYYNELGNIAYYTDKPDSLLNIYRAVRLLDGSNERSALSEEINEGQNANYPYVMPDGSTIYYAADGPESMGGYDIFVTRYNSTNGSYLQPENVGMPFNSPYNDYMYVIDEFSNLGWFASDRYQPEGKVCIYVFIPNETKQVYNYEGTDLQELIALSQLRSIEDTWSDEEAVKAAKHRLELVNEEVAQRNMKRDFEFVIDDAHTYYVTTDFKSDAAKLAFAQYQQLSESLAELEDRLAGLREEYAAAAGSQKQALAPGILDLEQRVLQLTQEVRNAANWVRREEQSTLK